MITDNIGSTGDYFSPWLVWCNKCCKYTHCDSAGCIPCRQNITYIDNTTIVYENITDRSTQGE